MVHNQNPGGFFSSASAPRGKRPDCRSRRHSIERNSQQDGRMKWLVIDIPCCAPGPRKSQEPSQNDVYRDKDVIIDQWGLRRISPSFLPARPEKDLQLQTFLLDRDRLPSNDDDCLSVASTSVGDEQMGATSIVSTKRRSIQFSSLNKREIIGRGSCGVVWRAVDFSLENDCSFAVKELTLDADEEKRRIIVDELRTAYRVHHPNLVTCYEVFFARGVFSMVMEHMDGGSLLDALKAASVRDGCGLPCAALACVGRGVAEALAYLHEELRVVHRDVKPSNILLSTSGLVKLGDLGICSCPGDDQQSTSEEESSGDEGGMPATSQWIGTVSYMSPERILGDRYSFNADVWSLGVVLSEAGLCRYPYALAQSSSGGGLQFWDLLDLVLTGPCPSDTLANKLPAGDLVAQKEAVQFVRQCLSKDRRDRPGARECLFHPFLARQGSPDAAAAGREAVAQWLALARAGGAVPSGCDSGEQLCPAIACGEGGEALADGRGQSRRTSSPPEEGAGGASPPRAAVAENILDRLIKAFAGGGLV